MSYAPPEGAFYLYIDVFGSAAHRRSGSRQITWPTPEGHRVPGSGCGDPHCIRISYAVEYEELIEGLGRFAQFISAIVID
nr:hypothetical protein [Pseudomonas protegens]